MATDEEWAARLAEKKQIKHTRECDKAFNWQPVEVAEGSYRCCRCGETTEEPKE